jgi:hypothetical protein
MEHGPVTDLGNSRECSLCSAEHGPVTDPGDSSSDTVKCVRRNMVPATDLGDSGTNKVTCSGRTTLISARSPD